MSTSNGAESRFPPTASTVNVVTSTSSSVATALPDWSVQGGWYSVSVDTSDVYLIFGKSDVAAAVLSSVGFYLPAQTVADYFIPGIVTHYRVIAKAAGVLSVARSGP